MAKLITREALAKFSQSVARSPDQLLSESETTTDSLQAVRTVPASQVLIYSAAGAAVGFTIRFILSCAGYAGWMWEQHGKSISFGEITADLGRSAMISLAFSFTVFVGYIVVKKLKER